MRIGEFTTTKATRIVPVPQVIDGSLALRLPARGYCAGPREIERRRRRAQRRLINWIETGDTRRGITPCR